MDQTARRIEGVTNESEVSSPPKVRARQNFSFRPLCKLPGPGYGFLDWVVHSAHVHVSSTISATSRSFGKHSEIR